MPETKIIDMTSVEKAVADFEEIMNEAQSFAKDKLLSEMDEKMNTLVKEFINKKKESEKTIVSESEKIDKESATADDKKEMSESKINETLDLTTASINEIEAAFDNAGGLDELEVVKDSLDVSSNGLDLAAPNGTDVLDTEEADDEISIEDIKSELDSIEQVEANPQAVQQEVSTSNNDPYLKLKKMHEELGNMLQEIEGQIQETEFKNTFNSKMSEMYGEGFEAKLGIDECGKMYETWKSNISASKAVDAPADPVAGKEDNIVAEEEVDESHGITLDHNKKVGQEKQPRQGKEYAKNRFRVALQKESADHAKKLAAVLKENKELNKKLNESKVEKKKLTEGYKKAVDLNVKMKDQLKDMAIFNTNIAYTNNILVNESLALTKEEKKMVIEKFKSVKTITESENAYNALIEEFKTSKTKINESIEAKVSSGVIAESNAKAIEKTALDSDPYAKIKKVMYSMDKKKK